MAFRACGHGLIARCLSAFPACWDGVSYLLEGVVPLRIVLVVQRWTGSWWCAAVGGRGVCPAAVLWGRGPIVWLQVSGVGAGGSWGVLERVYCAGPFQPGCVRVLVRYPQGLCRVRAL
jgi:hypothetical protein